MIIIPKLKEVFDKMATDIKSVLENTNPFYEKSVLKSFVYATSSRIRDVYYLLTEIVKQAFVHSATGINLEQIASNYGITRKAATQSTGNAIFTGTVGTLISAGTFLQDDASNRFETLVSDTISTNNATVSIVYTTTKATVTFTNPHSLSEKSQLTISGASESALNGTFDVDIVSNTVVTYDITASVGGSETGLSASYDTAKIQVQSVDYGADQNKDSSDNMYLETSILNVDDEVSVFIDGIGGGADLETDDSLRTRTLFKIQNPVTHFNIADVTNHLLKESYIERVFIITAKETPGAGEPGAGEAIIYFLKPNNAIPNASEITSAGAKLEEILPINTPIEAITIEAPTLLSIDFEFDALDPDSASMREAVESNLEAFFANETDIGTEITDKQYNRAILNTVNPENTNERIEDYNLVAPTGDITVATNEVPVLGTVTWSI